MQMVGIIVHHSACPSINGKGYDFFIMKNGTIIPAPYPNDPSFVHICLEGDFSDARELEHGATKEQLFLFMKLALRLSETMRFDPADLYPHTDDCPGAGFPWTQLVISGGDGYH